MSNSNAVTRSGVSAVRWASPDQRFAMNLNPGQTSPILTGDIVRLAGQYGRYGYRRIHALLEDQGWQVSHGRVMRIWRREGLRVPAKQPKRRRLWLNDGSCIRLRPERPNHVWSWDFVFDRTDDGRPIKLMVVIDEYTRQCLAIHTARRIRAKDAIDVFADLMEIHGIPEHIRADNGPEMVAKRSQALVRATGHEDCIHHTRQPLGEWLLRIVQWQAT